MRYAEISRKTNETDIKLALELDGKGIHDIKTGCGFLDHMLELFTSHGRFNIKLSCKGDTHVDFHHTVEDVGISLGQAFKNALGNKKGIARYGSFILPMDETLILSAIDFSGRVFLNYDVEIFTPKVGDFDTELSKEFWLGFARESFSTILATPKSPILNCPASLTKIFSGLISLCINFLPDALVSYDCWNICTITLSSSKFIERNKTSCKIRS